MHSLIVCGKSVLKKIALPCDRKPGERQEGRVSQWRYSTRCGPSENREAEVQFVGCALRTIPKKHPSPWKTKTPCEDEHELRVRGAHPTRLSVRLLESGRFNVEIEGRQKCVAFLTSRSNDLLDSANT
ncbi:hypothetical protein Q9Q94_05585 [Uliginosibacterium sp. 31-16]|uniref:hypothetical protein n=1 Tax=Uliginosibacterium sp. 31-16 TaxID=3068315 RepID=UPI00273E78C1|nr:hypothetical protein [Uliginosibacterium sp. 31-16]MDP5238991.1 hypothetical protein [Uliginosibacterium sp. 31-16]